MSVVAETRKANERDNEDVGEAEQKTFCGIVAVNCLAKQVPKGEGFSMLWVWLIRNL